VIYAKLSLGDKNFFTAQPNTWAELSETLLEEKPFLSYDPNKVDHNPELLNMFL
jgi:hypothetical protein